MVIVYHRSTNVDVVIVLMLMIHQYHREKVPNDGSSINYVKYN
jgi:cadmium resistance protein CadD (predicted permease)